MDPGSQGGILRRTVRPDKRVGVVLLVRGVTTPSDGVIPIRPSSSNLDQDPPFGDSKV